MQIKVICETLRREVLPRAPRDDWGSKTEKKCQVIEEFEREFGEIDIELDMLAANDPPQS